MTSSPQYTLQKAVFTQLDQDGALSAMIDGVYDEVPASASMPYVTLQVPACRDWSSVTTQGYEMELHCTAYSQQGGMKEATNIGQRMHELLHDASLTLDSPYTLISLRHSRTQALALDSKNYRAQRVVFTARVEAS